MPHLIVREPGLVAFSVPLHDGFRIGREPDNDLPLGDRQVSRRHLQLEATAAGWRARDLGSRHGTFHNGAAIQETPLVDGDRLQLGNVVVTFLAADERAVLASPAVTVELPQAASASPEGRRLRLLYQLGGAIGALGDRDALIGDLLAAVIDLFGCGRGIVGLLPGVAAPGAQQLERTARWHARLGERERDEIVVSRSVLHRLLERREPALINDATTRAGAETLARQRVLSAMGVPLLSGTRLWGFLYVDDRDEERRFAEDDLAFLMALGRLTAAALESGERLQQAELAAAALRDGSPVDELLGSSAPMLRLKEQIHKYAAAQGAHVLIQGESGTGKELVARTLHALSPRSEQALVSLNCAAIPESMIESELFGFERGAFTGAIKAKRGKLALAHRGTLFLDEIGDLSPSAQAKVLRAVEAGEVQPIGSEKTLHVDLRVVSATHKDLAAEVAAGRFREDLYYRLNVIELTVPALRERGDDVALLAEDFLQRAARRDGSSPRRLGSAARELLLRHRWPGNVRELRNEMERAAIVGGGPLVEPADLSPRLTVAAAAAGAAGGSLAERFARLEPTERGLVQEALAEARGNVSEAARLLGITRIMMRRRMERFGLQEGAGD